MSAVHAEMSAVLARPRSLPLAVATVGCVALVARPPLLRAAPDATVTLAVLFVALLAVGACLPTGARRAAPVCSPAVVVALGVGAFALGRLLGGGDAPGPLSVELVALNTLAAMAEEAFFRRLVFDALRPGGAAVAVVGSSVLFALVHVTVYGAWVLPVDLAAGLVLSWQRWASGGWGAPAATHVVANLAAVL